VVSVAWIMERGDDVIVYVFASEYITAQLRPTLRETSAPHCGSGFGDTLSSGPTKAWDWSLRPTCLTLNLGVPPATSTCAYINYSITLCESLSRLTAAAGNYAYAYHCQTWRSGMTSPWCPEESSLLMSTVLFLIMLATPRGN
jgi:hypothetical protein